MPTIRSVSAADSLATRLREARRARREHGGRPERGARELILIAFGVPLITVSVAVLIVLAVQLMAGGALSAVPSAVAACWLAVHQVPITFGGVTIGVLPILPTLLVAAGTALIAGSASRTRHGAELLTVILAAVAGPLLTTAICLAVVMDGSSVLPIQSPGALGAFGQTLLVHAVAAPVGVLLANRELVDARLTDGDRRGLRYGVVAALALFAAGGILVLLRLLLAWTSVGEMIGDGYDFDGYLGLTVLSILYLPNLMIGSAAVLLGSEAHIGAVSVDLFATRGGAVPPLPALAILPTDVVAWAPIGLAVPALIAVGVAWRCRSTDLAVYARSLAVAAAVAAAIVVVLGQLSGGRLGEVGGAGITIATAGVFTLGWILVAGVIVALVHNVLPWLRSGRDGSGRSGKARRRAAATTSTETDDGFDEILDDDPDTDDADTDDADTDDADTDDADTDDAFEDDEDEYQDAEYETFGGPDDEYGMSGRRDGAGAADDDPASADRIDVHHDHAGHGAGPDASRDTAAH
ncbi:cell division protein PerM [Gordonia sp. NPDC003376]